MLLDSTDEKNKRGLMSKFWDYVVDKMSTAVIGKLETKNKTVIGAINYLNGKSLKCKRFPSPSSDTDILEYAYNIVKTNEVGVEIIGTAIVTDGKAYDYSPGLILHNYDTCAILLINFTNGNIQTNVCTRADGWKGWKEFTGV
jgi:hypothetical protein